MRKIKVKDKSAIYAFKVEHAIYCDICETKDVTVIEVENEDETQICMDCIQQLKVLADKLI